MDIQTSKDFLQESNTKNSFTKKKVFRAIILVVLFLVMFSAGLFVGWIAFSYHVDQPSQIDFSLFWDAYGKLQKKFVNPEKINNDSVVYGAIKGMADSLEDPYTSFFEPTEAKKFQQDLAGSFDGIGVEIGIKKDRLTVVSPLEGSPGQKAGLRAGDIIAKVDGTDSTNITTDKAVNLIRGKKGTVVVLTIYRDGWTATKDFEITRDTIVIPTMKWEIKDGDVAYIQLFEFGDTLSSNFAKASQEILQNNSIKKIVLDLRGNPGGYLETAQNLAGWLLENGQIVTIEDFGSAREQKVYKAEGSGQLLKYPIVVLINGGSASASEILAGALRDNRGVQLIGEKSFGKGSVQEVVNLRGGSFLKITVAKWLTPKGSSIAEVGLEPDVEVEITDEDINNEKDPQLQKALEIIKALD